jgi:hypothetical protein
VGFPEPVRKLPYREPKLKYRKVRVTTPYEKKKRGGGSSVPKHTNIFKKRALTTDAAVRFDVGG